METIELRASGPTSGTSGVDTEQDLGATPIDVYIYWTKTAEANVDNLLTVRLQGKLGSAWVDLMPFWTLETEDLTVTPGKSQVLPGSVVDKTLLFKPDLIAADSTAPPVTWIAFFGAIPASLVRVIWIVSGTAVAITWEARAYWRKAAA